MVTAFEVCVRVAPDVPVSVTALENTERRMDVLPITRFPCPLLGFASPAASRGLPGDVRP
jgi:hypothetical protein